MGVVNTDPVLAVSSVLLLSANKGLGGNLRVLKSDVAVAAADSDTSTYRLFTGLDPNIRPLLFLIGCTAITAGTDYDIGIWNVDGPPTLLAGVVVPTLGTVISVDCLADTLDFHSAVALGVGTALNGMAALTAANVGKTLAEIAGLTSALTPAAVDIVAYANTVGSADGVISSMLIYAAKD